MNIQYFIQYDNLNDLARSLCQFGQRNNETVLPANSTPFKYKSKNGDMVIWCKAVSSLQEFAQSIEKRVGSDYLKEILDDC
jgi:hypothetical protein